MRIQAFLTDAAINLKRLAVALYGCFLLLVISNSTVSMKFQRTPRYDASLYRLIATGSEPEIAGQKSTSSTGPSCT